MALKNLNVNINLNYTKHAASTNLYLHDSDQLESSLATLVTVHH